jgi:hypothetical protein
MNSQPEIFIVVRPPPSSNNPLNLQIQLLTSYASNRRNNPSITNLSNKSKSSTVGFEISNETSSQSSHPQPSSTSNSDSSPHDHSNEPPTLTRTSSASSKASSVVDGSSVYSTGTTGTGSGRSKVVPLYNLSWHNIRQTEVLDAGRFHSRWSLRSG